MRAEGTNGIQGRPGEHRPNNLRAEGPSLLSAKGNALVIRIKIVALD
jgi:hypothetical protein